MRREYVNTERLQWKRVGKNDANTNDAAVICEESEKKAKSIQISSVSEYLIEPTKATVDDSNNGENKNSQNKSNEILIRMAQSYSKQSVPVHKHIA